MPRRKDSRVLRAPTNRPHARRPRVRKSGSAGSSKPSASRHLPSRLRKSSHVRSRPGNRAQSGPSRPSTPFLCRIPLGVPPPLVAPVPSTTREAPPAPRAPDTIVPERIPATARTERPAAQFEVHDIDEGWIAESIPAEISTSSTQGIGARLATAAGLRDAVVLREILGPPRSTQPFSHGTLG